MASARSPHRASDPSSAMRSLLTVGLAIVMTMGNLVLSAGPAYASVPEIRTARAATADSRGPLVSLGSTRVMGTHRSTDGGHTWVLDPTLLRVQQYGRWDSAHDGKLIGTEDVLSSPGVYTSRVVVYSVATGSAVTYDLPDSFSWRATDAWAMKAVDSYTLKVANLAAGTEQTLPSPTDPSILYIPNWEFGPSSAVLWWSIGSGWTKTFAVSASPVSATSAWVAIPGLLTYVLTATKFVYLAEVGAATMYCSRDLSNFAGSPSCIPTGSGVGHCDASALDYGAYRIFVLCVSAMPVEVFLATDASIRPVQLPAGSTWMDFMYPTVSSDGNPYVMTRPSGGAPTILSLLPDGTTAPGFGLPRQGAADVQALAVTPDRVEGADFRNGNAVHPDQWWTRTASASGFGGENVVDGPAYDVQSSAGRTAVAGGTTLSVFDRGQPSSTLPLPGPAADPSVGFTQLSGPYVSTTTNDWSSGPVVVSTVDGVTVGTFGAPAGILWGSDYVSAGIDIQRTGILHVTITDLTHKKPDRLIDLAPGSGDCGNVFVWGDTLATQCGVYSLVDGTLLYARPDFGFIEGLGDGYAVVQTYSPAGWMIHDFVHHESTALADCTQLPVTDGVGHVVCVSGTAIIWRDLSATVGTSAPRVLGWLAPASFSTGKWSPQIDVTKPFASGILRISQGQSVVREIPVPASSDGSVRGVTWDGRNAAGVTVQPGEYTAELVVSGKDGSGAVKAIDGTSAAATTVSWTGVGGVAPASGSFVSLTPSRLLDTRQEGGRLGAGEARGLQVAGKGGVPEAGVSAVVLNVTVTETTSSGFLTAWPKGSLRPTASNLNWAAGVTIPNSVTVKLGASGMLDIFQSGPGSAQVVVDVAGYYVDGPVVDPGGFTALAPSRILDTRVVGGPVAAGAVRDVHVTGIGDVPTANVSAVVLNVTVTDTISSGFLTVFPTGSALPTASNLNWSPGVTIPNLVVVKVGDAGKVSVYQSGPGSAQVIADVAGYYLGGTPDKPGTFVALAPSRVLDTRTSGAVLAGGDVSLSILGKGGVPASGVSAVVMNTTVTETRSGGFLTVYPSSVALPTASNLNWGTGTTIPNLVTVQTGADGVVKFHNGSQGSTQVIADTAGFYLG